MKKRNWLIAAGAALAVIAAFCLWYTRPLTFEQLCPGLDREKGDMLSASYNAAVTHPDGKVDTGFGSLNSEKDSPILGELFQILDRYTYRRSLTSFLPRPKAMTFRRRPAAWYVAVSGGFSLRLSTAAGRLELGYSGGSEELSLWCGVSDFEAFEQEVYDLLIAYTPEG